MKVIIFGSTGTIGKHLVVQALSHNHQVTAFCRNTNDLQQYSDKNLSKIKGNVFNIGDVHSAIKDHDAVIVVLGSGIGNKQKVRSKGTENVIAAMQKFGIKRLICQTTLGAGDSNQNLNFYWKHIMFGVLLKKMLIDHELQEEHVRNSDLNWTIIRPAAFTNGDKFEQYKHGFASNIKSLKLKISRADVADFILKQLSSDNYLYKSPGLSY